MVVRVHSRLVWCLFGVSRVSVYFYFLRIGVEGLFRVGLFGAGFGFWKVGLLYMVYLGWLRVYLGLV